MVGVRALVLSSSGACASDINLIPLGFCCEGTEAAELSLDVGLKKRTKNKMNSFTLTS